jgi:hypothetical protein
METISRIVKKVRGKMKKLLVLCLLAAVLMCSYTNKHADSIDSVTPTPVISEEPTIIPSPTPDDSDTQKITFDDQGEVEQLIEKCYRALERGDYQTAWECLSEQIRTPGSKVPKDKFQFKSLKLVRIKGYVPPSRENFTNLSWDVPKDVPNIHFAVKIIVKPTEDSTWEDGENICFIGVVKDSDGKWRINNTSTSP